MQSIAIGYGKATFSTSSVTLAGFAVEAPFIRTLASKKYDKQHATQRTPVSAHPDIDGWLFLDTVLAPDGAVFMVQMQFKYRGSGLRDGAIFIRARREGASIVISAKLPADARSTLTTNRHTVFSGCGDILTLEELQELDIDLSKNFVSAFMDEEEVAECFNVSIITPAVSAAPKEEKHITPTGEEVKLRIERSPRRMRVRR